MSLSSKVIVRNDNFHISMKNVWKTIVIPPALLRSPDKVRRPFCCCIVFSLSFLVHLSRMLKYTFVITRRPSSVCPSLTFIFSTSLKTLNGIQQNFTGIKILMSSTKFVFFGPIGKTRWPPWPLIGWDLFDFFSETVEQNSTKLDRKQDLNVLYEVCDFRTDRKNKMAALVSDWLRYFRLLLWNGWTEFNETW